MSTADNIARRWSTDGGMGNTRSDEDYTDEGCRILVKHAFVDVQVLLGRIAELERKNANLGRPLVDTVVAALAAHSNLVWVGRGTNQHRCVCGWSGQVSIKMGTHDGWNAHRAAAVIAALAAKGAL